MKTLGFFAAQGDLLPVLEAVDAGPSPLAYTRAGRTTGVPQSLSRGAELPRLGFASADASVQCDSWLVTPQTEPVHTRRIEGTTEVAVDQLLNAHSIVLTPGGEWELTFVIAGVLSTASETPGSKQLFTRFATALRRQFTKVGAFHVGPHALARLREGARLVAATQSSPTFDLKL